MIVRGGTRETVTVSGRSRMSSGLSLTAPAWRGHACRRLRETGAGGKLSGLWREGARGTRRRPPGR